MEVIMAWSNKLKIGFGCGAIGIIEFTCFHAGHCINNNPIGWVFDLAARQTILF